MKIDKIIVWHEFGHIFGYILVDRIYKDYRKITEIILSQDIKNPQIIPNKGDLKPIHSKEKELIKSILIYISGAIFHVTKFNEHNKTLLSDFNKIFLNTKYKPIIKDLYGHAGKDFHYIENFIEQEKSSINKLLVQKFTFELQQILKNDKIFEMLKPYITDFEKQYNGKNTKNSDLYNEERREIKKIIPDKLIIEIENLITEYYC